MKYGAAVVLAAIYAPMVFFDLPAAVALWTAILFFKDIKALSVGPNAMGVLIGLGFIGMFATRARTLPVLRQQRRLIIGVVLFMLWLTISIAWAQQPGTGASEVAFWWLGALAFLIVMTTATTARSIGLIALAFVVGATVAAVIGLASGGLSTAADGVAQTNQTVVNGRLTGGGGDPNLQAAGFIAAMFLVIGLFNVYRRRAARIGLIGAFGLITIAFFATQSRGGLLALGVSTVSTVALFPGQRHRLLGFVVIGLVTAGIAVTASPGSLSRITDLGGGTSGRSDIWAVATKVFEQHPLIGVGINNFPVVEPRYALLHKNVTRVQYLTGSNPYPAHNTYLQLLAETGIIGLAGFLAVLIGSLRASLLAARLLGKKGYRDYAYLAQASMMGTIGFLTAIFFFTDGSDWRVWILLGLGPALLALARSLPGNTGAPTIRKADSGVDATHLVEPRRGVARQA